MSNTLIWASLAALIAALAFWPTARWGVRVWIGIMWVALCWSVLARTKTLAVRSLFRILSLAIPWSFAIAFLSRWIAIGLADLAGVQKTAAFVVVASIVEEVLKLGPLALLVVLAPGRVRRFAVADWALVGFVSGLSFELVEESLRRILVMRERGNGLLGMLDLCGFETGGARLDCYGAATFGLNPFGTGVAGSPPYAGHAVLTGLVAVCVGLGVRIVRGGLLPRAFAWTTAVCLPSLALTVAFVDHAARNGSRNEVFDLVDLIVPDAIRWFHAVTGAGHGKEFLLLLLIAIGMVLDASTYRLASLADVIPDRPIGRIERTYIAARASADRLPRVHLAWFATSVVDLIFIVVRDLRDDAVLLFSTTDEPVVPGDDRPTSDPARVRAARRVREVRRLWDRQRAQREEVQRWAYDDPTTGRSRYRLVGVLAIVAGLVLVLIATPILTRWVDSGIDGGDLFGWLAGVLDAIGDWWDDLPLGWKIAGVVVLGAAIVASGGTLGLALGVGGAGWTAFDRADDLGRFVRDPKGSWDDYVAQNSPADIATDVGLLVVSFAGEGGLAAVGGKAAQGGIDAANRSGLTRSLRDHLGELPRAIVSIDPEAMTRIYSAGGTLGLKTGLPAWLRRVREGIRFHRDEQTKLDLVPGGTSELAVSKMGPDHIPMTTRSPNWVDHYNDIHRRILSIKHSQLAEIKEKTAMRYLNELAAKYRPGTPIADVPSTPERLLGKELGGHMYLHLPQQAAPIPDAILGRAETLRVIIIDNTGRIYR